MPRYQVTGIPPTLAQGSELGLSAFLPHYHRLAASGAQSYKAGVSGYPGTLRIPLPNVADSVPSPDQGDRALMGLSRSSDNVNAFWPNLYYNDSALQGPGDGNDRYYPGAGMPVQIYNPVRPQDTTMIPVPATDLRTVYQNRSALLSGGVAGEKSRKKALNQAIAFVRWPQRRTGNGPGTGG
jgi:hypothetical protein